jgi:hypothetical protein
MFTSVPAACPNVRATAVSNGSCASGFRVIQPPIATTPSQILSCYERNPGTRPGLAENNLHPVAQRELPASLLVLVAAEAAEGCEESIQGATPTGCLPSNAIEHASRKKNRTAMSYAVKVRCVQRVKPSVTRIRLPTVQGLRNGLSVALHQSLRSATQCFRALLRVSVPMNIFCANPCALC